MSDKLTARAIVPSKPDEHRLGNDLVEVLQIHRGQVHIRDVGPWSEEADKIAWIDRATGLHCIILRHDGGFLSGYVAVPPGHPLFGYDHRALPHTLQIDVHGGLDYAQPCDEHAAEVRSVCHVSELPRVPSRVAWWFGFSCDKPGDLIPDRVRRNEGAMEQPGVYRDEAYLYHQTIGLAAQLHAIGTDLPKPASAAKKSIKASDRKEQR